MGGRFFTDKHEAEIIAMYTEQEYTLAEIAEVIGFSESGVSKLMRRNNVKTSYYGRGALKRKLSTQDKERTIWLHEQMLSHRQMGEILGIGISAVRSRLARIRKECGRPKSRRGCWGRAGEPKTLPLHVVETVERWRNEDSQ